MFTGGNRNDRGRGFDGGHRNDRGRGFDGGHRGDSWGRGQNDRGHGAPRGGERNQFNRGNREHGGSSGGSFERHNAPLKVDSQTSNDQSANDRNSVTSGDDGERRFQVVRNRKQRGSTSGMQEGNVYGASRHRGK